MKCEWKLITGKRKISCICFRRETASELDKNETISFMQSAHFHITHLNRTCYVCMLIFQSDTQFVGVARLF